MKTHIKTVFGDFYCGSKFGKWTFPDYVFPNVLTYRKRLAQKDICRTCLSGFNKVLRKIKKKTISKID